MANDRLFYFMASLDFHLDGGEKPGIALEKAVEDYAAVYHVDDERTPLQRAAAVTLGRLNLVKEKRDGT